MVERFLINSKLNKFLLVLLTPIIIGSFVAYSPKLTLLSFIAIGLFIFSWYNWKITLILGTIIFFVIPFGSYQFFKLEFFGVDAFTLLFFMLLSVLIAKNVLIKKFSLPNLGALFYILIILISFYGVISISNQYFFAEFKMYLYFILFPLFVYLFKREKSGMDLLIKVSVVASLLLSIVIIFIFLFKSSIFSPLFEGTFYEYGSRVAISNTSIFLLTVPILVFAIMNKVLNRHWNIFILFTLPLILIAAIMGQSRTLIAGIIINTFIAVVLSLYFSKKRVMVNIMFIGISMIMIAVMTIIGFAYFSLGEIIYSTLDRFMEIFQSDSVQTMNVRSYSNQYALNTINRNLLGLGIGSTMYLIDFNGHVHSEGFFIDNGFITILYKFGVIGFLIFISFYIRNLLSIVKVNRKNRKQTKGNFSLTILWCMPIFLISGLYMSAQLVMNGVILGFSLMIFAYFFVEKTKDH